MNKNWDESTDFRRNYRMERHYLKHQQQMIEKDKKYLQERVYQCDRPRTNGPDITELTMQET